MINQEEDIFPKKRSIGKTTQLVIASMFAGIAVQLANMGYDHVYSLQEAADNNIELLQPKPVIDQVNFAKLLIEARKQIHEENFTEAAKSLDALINSDDKKILLEVAKIRIRRDTPLYSYEIASNILLTMVEIEALRGEAAFVLARHHMRAFDVETQKKAEPLLQQALQWEFEIAHSYLGDIYAKGIGTEKKLLVALAHYEKAATTFSAAPIIAFARRIASLKAGEFNCGIKPEKIIQRHLSSLQTEARGGKVSAAKELGRIFFKGKLVKRDIIEARKWLNISADSGNPGAMRDLAMLEMKFPVSEHSMDTAISLLKKSAKAGNASAYTSLGRIYMKEKTPEMEEKAIKAFETAALSGHKAAILELQKLNRSFQQAAIGIDPVITGAINTTNSKPVELHKQLRISEEILNASVNSADNEVYICEKPDTEKFATIIPYLE